MQTVTVSVRAAAVRRVLRPTRLSSHLRAYATPATTKQDEDPQLAGYPQLPNISRQYLPPRGWDDQQMRRNFGDTLHEQEELYSMWGPDVPIVPPRTALRQLLIATLAFVSFGFFVYAITPARPTIPREYPYSGLVKELGGIDNQARPEDESEED